MKICIATATRAEYGLLKPLIDLLKADDSFSVQLLVTGAHLSPEFGLTHKQIDTESVEVYKTEMLMSSDSPSGISKTMGLGMISFSEAFENLKPDAVVVLGDRYEMLSLVSTAMIFQVPVIHLHGGEITEGAYDDSIRHAISKLSHFHFTSTEEYKNRVIQLGENPNTVFNVGAIGIDNIQALSLLNKEQLEKELNVSFKKNIFIVAFHPETLGSMSSEEQFKALLKAIDKQEDAFFVFTKSNADTDGRIINELIDSYAAENKDKAASFFSLGSLRFLSLMKVANGIIGNSSSGIIEAPSLSAVTINIGDRQKGRIQAASTINTGNSTKEIAEAIKKACNDEFLNSVNNIANPYGNGGTALKIVAELKKINFKELPNKSFYDL